MSDSKKNSVTTIGDEMLDLVAIPTRQNRPRVLVVDDDAYSLALIEKMLKSMGIEEVITASDGNLAWGLIRKSLREHRPFSLVLSDWNMPTGDGMKLLTKVRGHQETHGIPLVMLTGRHRREDVEEAIQSKVTGYIAKPVDAKTLKEKVEAILGPLPAKKKAS